MASAVLTVRLNQDTKEKLEQLANATHRTKSFLAVEAINRYLEIEAWQIAEIEQALVEADKADFASEDEVNALAKKYAY
jgi:RHH-type rel operon transcriptional repressor/antitoxin RelB